VHSVVIAAVGDPGASRLVLAIIVVLVLIGVGLAGVAVWLWRRTTPEPVALAVLETMGERRFRTGDDAERLRLLEEARGAIGAERVAPDTGAVPSDHG
jgi:hypothetical protein